MQGKSLYYDSGHELLFIYFTKINSASRKKTQYRESAKIIKVKF